MKLKRIDNKETGRLTLIRENGKSWFEVFDGDVIFKYNTLSELTKVWEDE